MYENYEIDDFRTLCKPVMGATHPTDLKLSTRILDRPLHHLDAPWRPRDIEQREGRILRQGNLNEEVEIYRYVTEGSFDAYMWQTLETKARFIAQVMNGKTAVRSAEDLDGGALTYAEVKAIASGNPAVIEKVKTDTEIRKLDQLRAAHIGQQHTIRLKVHALPDEISQRQEKIARLHEDIARRDKHGNDEFSMEVEGQVFSGKGAREVAAAMLNQAALSGRHDPELRTRGSFRGFELLSRGRAGGTLLEEGDALPALFLKGSGLYGAQLNADNPVGTMQSIEHALRAFDRAITDESESLARCEKMLSDYREQMDRPFAHEARLKELLARQEELNAALDLGKGEMQAAPEEAGESGGGDGLPAPSTAETPARKPAWQDRETPRRQQRVHKHKPRTLRPGM